MCLFSLFFRSHANGKEPDLYCDECGTYLNSQPEFTTETGVWECTDCGALNDVPSFNARYDEEDDDFANFDDCFEDDDWM